MASEKKKNSTIYTPDNLKGEVSVFILYPGIPVTCSLNNKLSLPAQKNIGEIYMPPSVKAGVPDWFDKYVMVFPHLHTQPYVSVKKEVDEVLASKGLTLKSLNVGVFSGSGNLSIPTTEKLTTFLVMDTVVGGNTEANTSRVLKEGGKVFCMFGPSNWGGAAKGYGTDYWKKVWSKLNKEDWGEINQSTYKSFGFPPDASSGCGQQMWHMVMPQYFLKYFKSKIEAAQAPTTNNQTVNNNQQNQQNQNTQTTNSQTTNNQPSNQAPVAQTPETSPNKDWTMGTQSQPFSEGTYNFNVERKNFFVIPNIGELRVATEEDLKNFQKTGLELVDQEYIETPYQGGEEVYIENPITGSFVPSETKQKISEIKGVSQENVPDEVSTDTKSKYVVSKDKEKNVQAIIKACKENGVTNEFAITGILSIVSKESAFVPKNEASYKTTPGERIIKIFGARGKTATQWDEIKKDDKQFFDIVYGPTPPAKTKYGNGPDDGYKYRGRGFNQITFKGNYEKYAKLTGLDLVNDPDLLNTIEAAAKCVVLYFKSGINGAPKFAKTQYNFTDINSFKNLQDAVGACYHANAGFGNSTEHILADVTGGRAKAFKNSTPLYNTYKNDIA